MNTASRTEALHLMQNFGHLPNGSMPRYNSTSARTLSTSPNKFNNLGAVNNGTNWVGIAGVSLIWIGLDFPGTDTAVKIIRALIDQPKKTIQAVSLLSGIGIAFVSAGA